MQPFAPDHFSFFSSWIFLRGVYLAAPVRSAQQGPCLLKFPLGPNGDSTRREADFLSSGPVALLAVTGCLVALLAWAGLPLFVFVRVDRQGRRPACGHRIE
jgi:hypothetical protein